MNEITKFDEEGNITKEWSEYVKNLDREDLETFFIGADALINKAIKYIEDNGIIDLNGYDLLSLLKGDPKSN